MGRLSQKEIPGEEKYPVGMAGTEAESLLRGGLPAGGGGPDTGLEKSSRPQEPLELGREVSSSRRKHHRSGI